MPVSHICPSCLTELARVRAVQDPHYRLPLVRCPGCDSVHVRTPHPDRVFWRQIRLLLAGLWSLVWRLGLMTLAGLLLAMSVLAIGYNFDQWLEGETPVSEPDPGWGEVALFVMVILVLPILAGLFTRLVVVVRSIWRAAALLLAFAFAWILNFELSAYLVMIDYANAIQTGGTYDGPLSVDRPMLVLGLLFSAMLLGGLGWLLGRFIQAFSRWIGGSPLRRGLKRARKRRVRLAGG